MQEPKRELIIFYLPYTKILPLSEVDLDVNSGSITQEVLFDPPVVLNLTGRGYIKPYRLISTISVAEVMRKETLFYVV